MGEHLRVSLPFPSDLDPPLPPFLRQGRFIHNGMYFVNMNGDKYQGKSHKLLTILMPKIEYQARFLSPEPLHF
ncbi:hypothetical protein [Nostoc sp. 106C]|uniref:hypothetical protein n=1 Tax=Nostoc sp. 106C TaxID=1932667 RepID=UPI000A3D44FB|nr:hypothetical protein [Nostoc sp. 106C]OUL20699.1 hypothetical protein BV375_30610 [Nostoc sp. 106C]